MKAEVRVDDARVMAGLKAASRDINQGVKEGLKRGAELHGLPTAKRLAPGHRIRAALHAGATTRTAYLEVRSREVPFAGLLEFGGTRRDVLLPKSAKAMRTPYGPRAVVRGPRHYRAQHYLRRAVQRSYAAVVREAQDTLVKLLARHLEME
jgi:hypothetical protein